MDLMHASKWIVYRRPTTKDAREIWRLVQNSGRLDLNSAYCYLVLFRYFAETCLVAERDGELLGFVTAFRPPSDSETLFVWQIAVAERARGQGIGTKLLQILLQQLPSDSVSRLEATVSPGNGPSRRLFEAFAKLQGSVCETVTGGFAADVFPETGHEDEPLIRIELRTLRRNC